MADLKISQLTAATTPLAGTEVLPIVQSGTTKQVSVANLTAGRSVLASALGVGGAINPSYAITSYGSITSTGGANFLAGTLGVGTTPAYNLDVVAGGGAALIFRAGQSGVTNGFTISSTGSELSYTFQTGNLIQGTAAKGVNFTANTPAAGMTSQLLNWYEEGTWTPTQGSGLIVVGAFTSSGTYTRVGRIVTLSGRVQGATSVAVSAGGIITSAVPWQAASTGTGAAVNSAKNASATTILGGGSFNLYSVQAVTTTTFIDFTVIYSV